MNKHKTIIFALITINIIFLVLIINTNVKLEAVESSRENQVVDATEETTEDSLKKELEWLEGQMYFLEQEVKRIEDLIIRIPGIDFNYGSIVGLKEEGEEVIVEFESNDREDMTISIDQDTQIFMMSEKGYVKVDLEELINKVKVEQEENFVDEYTIININDKWTHIYQGRYGQI
ncbi:hypothetical protein RH915_08245 [Serpentinicella sp. ANB-PHB4]|uniref:hypothetical protein n=1 Tax=Serpentinicella sp. ANB-PHB4 TaxID=3074076 RepID=UPI00285FD02B|nr:hypothetical protein [Serpentinicella sp. ANB-PHB4]MDR5659480.1 hypothetical protein [Serpentinicella sp. ANB-PHB4]